MESTVIGKMARYNKQTFYTDEELENILAHSDEEELENIPAEESDDGWEIEEHDDATPEPTYAPPESTENSDSWDSESSVEEPKGHIKKRPKNITKKTEQFLWKNEDLDPKMHRFSAEYSGSNIHVNSNTGLTELECFQQFFGEDIVQHITEQTNLYFICLSSHNPADKSRLRRWKDTNLGEMYCFFAVNFLMAQVKKNKINNYWSNDFLTSTPGFKQIMTRDRFLLLLRVLHFVDNREEAPITDKLWKIRPVVDHLKDRMQETLYPFENLCIDESLVLFKGRVFFKQYIPSKRHRFGIKIFILCDCETGYILNFLIYTGKYTEILPEEEALKEMGVSGRVVVTLMGHYLEKGHSLFLDNWYVSPSLFLYLHQRKTNACGTVKKNRKGMPSLDKTLSKGAIEYKSTDRILALKWQDKREVRMLSTIHNSEIIGTGKVDHETDQEKLKPHCVIDYNEYMGAIDRSDMMLSSCESVRRTVKWYKKVFFHLLDLALFDAHATYMSTTGNKVTLECFQHKVVTQILEKYHTPEDANNYRTGRRRLDSDNPMRLSGRHFPSLIPSTENKKQAQKRCVVCSKNNKRRDTRFMCAECSVALCVTTCFEIFHTVKNY